ncbi:MAG TPA: aminotransferase class III-fold pyridoxal phosphate-dependent enzyme, partial [Gemmatimonadaceae bacterium]|nr:aminotransferase class III-fold pyridoxal phosphate-dependent enzyme [Gemmatimonadaceae bacterium]
MTDTLIESQAGADTSESASPSILATYKRAPMRFVRGAGVELYDEEGKAYLDLSSGIAVNALGYNDAGIRRVIEEVLDSGLVHVSNLYQAGPGERLARFLTENSFASSVFFCNSGAEANEGAFKFVRRWGRATATDAKTGIVALRGGFHGRLFASLAATDRPSYRAPFRPLAGGVSICERDP